MHSNSDKTRLRQLESLVSDYRNHDSTPCALVLLDVDNFHPTVQDLANPNERLLILDQVLQWLCAHFPGEPVMYRHGVDSLLALHWGTGANQLTEGLFALLNSFRSVAFHTDRDRPRSYTFTFTATITEYPTYADSLLDAIRSTEDALYEAKLAGKNTVSFATRRRMILKTSYYTPLQLKRLTDLAANQGMSEAQILREALDDVLRKYRK